MSTIPRLVGMIHLQPLPGSPRYAGSFDQVLETSIDEATFLKEAGFPALMVENFGDAPFRADTSDPETIAAMSLAVRAVVEKTDLPVGVNVLRNDALSALAIASVAGARFIRVNVLTGLMYTDQGPIVGRADEVARRRAVLDAEIEVWADVMVKHATPPAGLTMEQAVEDTVVRGLADAVIVSGPGTGVEPDADEAARARSALPKGVRLVIGSGAGLDNLGSLADVADTIIVGSSLKIDGNANEGLDPERVAAFIEAARHHGLV